MSIEIVQTGRKSLREKSSTLCKLREEVDRWLTVVSMGDITIMRVVGVMEVEDLIDIMREEEMKGLKGVEEIDLREIGVIDLKGVGVVIMRDLLCMSIGGVDPWLWGVSQVKEVEVNNTIESTMKIEAPIMKGIVCK